MKKMNTIIFDFDGVIANSLDVKVDIAVKIINEMGIKFDSMNKSSIKELIRTKGYLWLLKKIKFPFYKVPSLLSRMNLEQSKNNDKIKIVPSIKNVLAKLSKNNRILMLTGNNEDFIKSFLDRYRITNFFEKIYSDKKVKGKENVFEEFFTENLVDINKTFYVGDEISDITNSKKYKIKSIACTWGLTSSENLVKSSPDFIANKPSEIYKYIIGSK